MKVRRAEPTDVDDLRRMATSFHALSCYADSVEINLDSFLDTIARLSTSATAVVLVAEQGRVCGMAAAFCSRHWFNADHIIGQELFWWVDEDARKSGAGLALLRELEEWAKGVGCHSFCMATTANLTPERLGRLYRKRGYRPEDIYYRRAL